MRPTTITALLALSVTGPLSLHAQASRSAAPANAVTIGTVDTLTSTALKEKRPYWVYTPPSYHDSTYTPRRYPVLYLLDGDAHFHSVTGLLQILGTGVNGTYVVPEMIVVAIPNTTDRMRDLTPTHTELGFDGKPSPAMKTSGGMPTFLQFVQKELIPHIDSAYRTAPYRVFVGHSLGGITTIDALYTMPETFNAYVAIDPSLWWDNGTLLKQAKERFSKPLPTKRVLYVGQANTLNPDDTLPNPHFNDIVQFNSVMEAYNKAGVRYGYKYYPGDDHGSVPLIAEYDALRFIFKDFKSDLVRGITHPEYITEHFSQLSQEFGYTMLPPEGMLDLMGIVGGQVPGARTIEILQMATRLYPKSAHALVSLGNGYVAKGEKQSAITAYERALVIDPKNKAAADGVQKAKATK